MKTERQQAAAAAAFAQRWKGRGYERGESQPFWIDLLSNVYGIETPSDGFISFEDHRMVDASNFIDGRIPSTKVLIEQKSLGKDLRAGIRQSDGSLLNPFQQARRYVVSLPVSEHPRWIVTCNFAEFLVYDMEQPNGEPQQIRLENLGKEYYRLQFLVDAKSEHLSKEMEVSIEAGKIVGYFAYLQSPEPTYATIYEGKWLDDEKPYHVVHRIASYPEVRGIFSSIIDFCFSHDTNIRIDTHRDNIIMQHNLQKHGFSYCGIIYLLSGDERLAYQKIGTE